jgi:hypothetical protein
VAAEDRADTAPHLLGPGTVIPDIFDGFGPGRGPRPGGRDARPGGGGARPGGRTARPGEHAHKGISTGPPLAEVSPFRALVSFKTYSLWRGRRLVWERAFGPVILTPKVRNTPAQGNALGI